MRMSMKRNMRGLVKEINGPSQLVFHDDLPVPEISDTEVLVKVYYGNICGTDLHIEEWDTWSQLRVKAPVITCHEIVGTIAEVGKDVTDRREGQRVAIEPMIPCGKCYLCTHGMSNICKDIRILGVTDNGGFAEYVKVPADYTFPLDDEITFEAAALMQPMGTGVYGAEMAEVKGKNVLISGCGSLGLAAVSACRVFGAKRIIAVDVKDSQVELALEMGADVAFNSMEHDVCGRIMELTDSVGVDAAIDISGVEAAILSDIKAVRPGGIFVGVGLPTKKIALDLTNDVFYREVRITGVSGRKVWRTWNNFAAILKSPFFKADRFIGGIYPLSDYQSAFAAARSGVPGKMLLHPED